MSVDESGLTYEPSLGKPKIRAEFAQVRQVSLSGDEALTVVTDAGTFTVTSKLNGFQQFRSDMEQLVAGHR